MTTSAWRQVPVSVVTDPEHGGRWTSLLGGEREWLWTNPDTSLQGARAAVEPGDAFIDAGGVEECLPTVRGQPDHGAAWSRPWQQFRAGAEEGQWVGGGSPARISRWMHSVGDATRVDYAISGAAGASFVHAVHALLDLSLDARLVPAGAFEMVVLDEPLPGDVTARPWSSGLDSLGPEDGSATCAILLGCSGAEVVDGDDRLSLRWSSDDPRLCSLIVWRNLAGWPVGAPYRSIGIEPLIGRAADLAAAGPAERAYLPPGGVFRWSLTVTASRRVNPLSSLQCRPGRPAPPGPANTSLTGARKMGSLSTEE